MNWQQMIKDHKHNMTLVAGLLPPEISSQVDQLLEAGLDKEADKVNHFLCTALESKGFKINSLADCTVLLQGLQLHPDIQIAMIAAMHNPKGGPQLMIDALCTLFGIEKVDVSKAMEQLTKPIENLVKAVCA